MRNHPGWAKGAMVRLNDGRLVKCLEDGEYISDDRTFGLWHYWVRDEETGVASVRIPEVGDQPISNSPATPAEKQ